MCLGACWGLICVLGRPCVQEGGWTWGAPGLSIEEAPVRGESRARGWVFCRGVGFNVQNSQAHLKEKDIRSKTEVQRHNIILKPYMLSEEVEMNNSQMHKHCCSRNKTKTAYSVGVQRPLRGGTEADLTADVRRCGTPGEPVGAENWSSGPG